MKPLPLLRNSPWLLLLVVFLLAACTPIAPSATPTSDPIAPSKTATSTPTSLPTLGIDPDALRGVTLPVWHAFSGDSYGVFGQQVALFNAVNEWGITVVESGYGDYLTLFEAVQEAAASGELPGLVVTLPEQALAWQEDDLVADSAPYFSDPVFGLSEAELTDFPEAFLDGPGLPAQRSARFLLYNQTWAQELGFNAPPYTPDEFRQQACAANASFKADTNLQNDGYGGWVVDTHWQTAYSWMLALGGSVTDGAGYTFDSTDNQAALETLKGLYDDNCAWLSTDPAPYDAFARRRALFVTIDLAEVPAAVLAMDDLINTDEWSLIPFPGEEAPLSVAYGPSYVLMQSAPTEQLAAWLFARWLVSPENQALWVEATGLLPLRSSVLDLVAPYGNASPQWAAAAASLDLLRGTPLLASWREVRYVLADGLTTLFQVNLPPDQLPALLEEMQALAEEVSDG